MTSPKVQKLYNNYARRKYTVPYPFPEPNIKDRSDYRWENYNSYKKKHEDRAALVTKLLDEGQNARLEEEERSDGYCPTCYSSWKVTALYIGDQLIEDLDEDVTDILAEILESELPD